MSKFSKRIKELREEKKITQQDLSNILKRYNIILTPQAISFWENGKDNKKVEPKYEVLIALADIFKVDVDYLIGARDYYNKNDKYILGELMKDKGFIGIVKDDIIRLSNDKIEIKKRHIEEFNEIKSICSIISKKIENIEMRYQERG